jgi:hypothetical protein
MGNVFVITDTPLQSTMIVEPHAVKISLEEPKPTIMT